jgi:polar amino acid transport system substrate-binding protein
LDSVSGKHQVNFKHLFVVPAVAMLLAACAAIPGPTPLLQEIAPTGRLRVGIGVGAVSSAFWATPDAATGKPRGVTVDLGGEFAKRLGVPLELVVYNNSGEVTAGGPRGDWDVAFMPVDTERTKLVDFGPAYYLFESTYLVPAGSAIRSIAEVDRPGVRVVGIENTTTARSAARTLKNTTVQTFRTVDEITERLRSGNADAVALGRESLDSLAQKFPGSRVLPGNFQATGVAIAVPKGRQGSLVCATAFIEIAKAGGLVRRALDAAGLKDAPVAPASSLAPAASISSGGASAC